ncbi:MAG: hypothetical protein IKM46_08840 [Clostridia bacterium]|nr:hypothetical protein [Clostridia bacterium]
MDNSKEHVIRDNFGWLRESVNDHRQIEGAVINKAVKLVLCDKPSLTPMESHEIFKSLSGEFYSLPLFARFCAELTRSLKIIDENAQNLSPRLTVYIRNQLADKAFDVFSRQFHGLRAIYSHDFKSACEDVYYDRADSCILPLESSADGLLMPFRSMLMKYELKIAAVTKVSTGEGSVQSIALVTGGTVDSFGNVLEAYLPSVTQNDLLSLCIAVSEIGCNIVRITSVKSPMKDLYDHHISFTSDSNSLSVLKYFLNGKYPAHVILGQYKN